MNDEIGQLLYEAALRVAQDMGKQLLEMSCFVSNWESQTVETEEFELLAA